MLVVFFSLDESRWLDHVDDCFINTLFFSYRWMNFYHGATRLILTMTTLMMVVAIINNSILTTVRRDHLHHRLLRPIWVSHTRDVHLFNLLTD